MSTALFEVAAPPPIDRRGLQYAVALSLCLHAIAVAYLTLSNRNATESGLAAAPEFSVRLKWHDPEPTTRPSEPELDNILLPAVERIATHTPATRPPASETENPTNRLLDISRSSLHAAIRDYKPMPEWGKRHSDNGAVVLDTHLLHTLNTAERRLGLVNGDSPIQTEASFSGASWTDLVRLGDKCFKISRGNPLQPGSEDMWFRVACLQR